MQRHRPLARQHFCRDDKHRVRHPMGVGAQLPVHIALAVGGVDAERQFSSPNRAAVHAVALIEQDGDMGRVAGTVDGAVGQQLGLLRHRARGMSDVSRIGVEYERVPSAGNVQFAHILVFRLHPETPVRIADGRVHGFLLIPVQHHHLLTLYRVSAHRFHQLEVLAVAQQEKVRAVDDGIGVRLAELLVL